MSVGIDSCTWNCTEQLHTKKYGAVKFTAVYAHDTVQGVFNALQCRAVKCGTLQYNAVQISAVQYSRVNCSAVQCSGVMCSCIQDQAPTYMRTSHWICRKDWTQHLNTRPLVCGLMIQTTNKYFNINKGERQLFGNTITLQNLPISKTQLHIPFISYQNTNLK